MATAPSSPGGAGADGGAVAPAQRAAGAKSTGPAPQDRERGNPFADAAHRGRGVAEDARHTGEETVNGPWPRGARLPAAKDRPPVAAPRGADVLEPAEGGGRRAAASPATAGKTDAAAMSRLEAEAERAALAARLEVALKERYVVKKAPVSIGALTIGQVEYRFRSDTSRIAFTESTFRLSTQTSNPSVARSMVEVAQARNWRGLRISGADDFRRLVWLEASVRGVKAVGYEPDPRDLDMLRRERDARQTHRVEPALDASTEASAARAARAPSGACGRPAVVAAIDAVLSAKKVPQARRAAVLAAVAEKLVRRERGELAPHVKVDDPSAWPQQTSPGHPRGPGRSREPTSPAPVR